MCVVYIWFKNRDFHALQDQLSEEDDENKTGEPVTSQPASSIPMPMPPPTEKTNLQETGSVPSYGVE